MKRKKKRSGLLFKIRVGTYLAVITLCILGVNTIFHIFRKPSEIISIFSKTQSKSLRQTWKDYGSYFQRHATSDLNSLYLAALAQVESGGRALASPKWKFGSSLSLAGFYGPESSSLGLMQITDGTYERARKLCVHNGAVRQEGPWHDLSSCWFNFLYSRTSASDSIEMTSAFLQNQINGILERYEGPVSNKNKKRLASIIHLCGEDAGMRFVRSRFSLNFQSRCGSHNLKNYVTRIERIEDQLKSFQ